MIKLSDVFLKHLPTLDLHGEYRDVAIVLLKDFIEENKILKKEKIVVIHGIGTNILRTEIKAYLKGRKDIESYYQDPFNAGITIINIKVYK